MEKLLGYEWYVCLSVRQVSLMRNETVKLQGLARTQIPTNKNGGKHHQTFPNEIFPPNY